MERVVVVIWFSRGIPTVRLLYDMIFQGSDAEIHQFCDSFKWNIVAQCLLSEERKNSTATKIDFLDSIHLAALIELRVVALSFPFFTFKLFVKFSLRLMTSEAPDRPPDPHDVGYRLAQRK